MREYSDADGVDRFLDEQATGPDIYADYVPPRAPRWWELREWEEAAVTATHGSEQWRDAMAKGNAVRTAIHAIRRELNQLDRRASARRLATLIDLEDPTVLHLPVDRALQLVNGIGPARSREIILWAGLNSFGGRRLEETSARQRAFIVEVLLEMFQ
jgi:hypothetical protein